MRVVDDLGEPEVRDLGVSHLVEQNVGCERGEREREREGEREGDIFVIATSHYSVARYSGLGVALCETSGKDK